VCATLVAVGCGGASGSEERSARSLEAGSVSFGFDVFALTTATMTAATTTFSRDGYGEISRPLAVSNGFASGQVDGLDPGYWRVAVEAYDGPTLIVTATDNVNVVAGVTVFCLVRFAPVVLHPETPLSGPTGVSDQLPGSVVIEVGSQGTTKPFSPANPGP
jgi:hypothetical protein